MSTTEIAIPPEIKRRGEKAIQIFREALDKGAKKIPYCSMLILGKEKMGKTSLYRQLVGKEYKKDLESTKGIDNNTVDIVDKRNVNISKCVEKWEEKGIPNTGEHFTQALAGELAGKFDTPAQKEKDPKPVTQLELLSQIKQIVAEIAKAKEKAKPCQSPPQLHRPLVFNPFPLQAPAALPDAPPDPGIPSAPKKSRTEPPSQPKPKVQERPPPPPPPPLQNPPVLPRDPSPPHPSPEPMVALSPSEDKDKESTDVVSSPKHSPMATNTGLLNRKQSFQIDQIVRGRQVAVKKPLPPVLNTLDFAGQEMYRPMHHCFISRRAVYVVVFKIPDMLAFIEHDENPLKVGYDPISEIRYWIQSIHAHIKTQDETISRVILVGTHRGVPECLYGKFTNDNSIMPQCSEDNLTKIDKFIRKKLMSKNSKCLNHIHLISKEYSKLCFLLKIRLMSCMQLMVRSTWRRAELAPCRSRSKR